MNEKSLLQRVRDAASKRGMTFEQYLQYAGQYGNDLTGDEQWDAGLIESAFRRTVGADDQEQAAQADDRYNERRANWRQGDAL